MQISKGFTPNIQSYVLASEGGYVNHPRDPGKATNMGILITARGSGYTSPPTVTVSGGTGATFTTDYAKRSPGQDRPLKLLTFTACTIAGVAADGPNVLGIPAGNISVPANGHITLRGRGEQWRVESKNF